MISKLLIKNFQCHKKLVLELDPHITTIVGSSDTGKSAIIRALRWLCLNKPNGTEFIKDGEKYVSVKAWVDNTAILRRRGAGSNLYKIAGSEYRAFGSGRVAEISGRIKVEETHIQSQHEAPFWFTLSPGQVSKELNQIVNLETIDKALGNIASRQRSAKAKAEVIKERLKTARQTKKELAWTKVASVKIGELATLADLVEDKRNSKAALAILLEQAAQCQRVKDAAAGATAVAKVLAKKAEPLLNQRSKPLHELLVSISKQIKMYNDAASHLTGIKQQLAKVKKCPTCGQMIAS